VSLLLDWQAYFNKMNRPGVLKPTSTTAGLFNYDEIKHPKDYIAFLSLLTDKGDFYLAPGIGIYKFPERAQAINLRKRLQTDLGDLASNFEFKLDSEESWHRTEGSLYIVHKNQTPKVNTDVDKE
jgi:hypothetical protein